MAESWRKQRQALDDAQVLLELAEEASDESSAKEADETTLVVERAVGQMEFARMLSGPNDNAPALVSINSGAGGVDAQDWAEILMRMYLRWCERKGYRTEILDQQPGEEAGIKSATFTVEGEWAFGYLRSENGVHRLVRISPFDSNARRHTSFAAVFVYPDLDEAIKIEIRDEDLEIQTFRSGGAGGQHVNKTESAVRIIHKPSGIVVGCQTERSQHKNRSSAMKMLRARLYEKEEQEKAAKMGDVHAQKKSIEWSSQIRSYVLAPYRLVNDHRTEVKIGNVDAVLDGELDEFNKEKAHKLTDIGLATMRPRSLLERDGKMWVEPPIRLVTRCQGIVVPNGPSGALSLGMLKLKWRPHRLRDHSRSLEKGETAMGKAARIKRERQAENFGQQILPLPMLMFTLRRGLREFVVETGMHALEALLEEERTAACGTRYEHDGERTATRYGYAPGEVVLGGRRVRVKRPRVRSVDGEREIILPYWQQFSSEDPLNRDAVECRGRGVIRRISAACNHVIRPSTAAGSERSPCRFKLPKFVPRLLELEVARCR